MPGSCSTCQIALGGNVGDVRMTFEAALSRLAERDLRVIAVSRIFSTPPMGSDAGGTFLNAAATLETSLEPLAVLDRLLATEDALGRVRTTHWGPRTIDLDLVLWGDRVIDAPRLRLPHVGLWYRRFVLDPLADLVPEAIHPETGEPIVRLRERLTQRPLPVALVGSEDARAKAATALQPDFEIAFVAEDADPAVTFAIGQTGTDAATRTIGVPAADRNWELPRAVLAAALGEPVALDPMPLPRDVERPANHAKNANEGTARANE